MSQRKKRRGSAGSGAVVALVALFLGSAGLRLVMNADTAWAQSEIASRSNSATTTGSDEELKQEERAELGTLLSALQEREKTVSEREKQLEVRNKALEIAQREVERRIEALEQTEQKLKATLALVDEAAEQDVARLTTVYENMKPKDAAALFQAMEPEFAAGFLARMRPDVAAKIMAGLDPVNAYSISAILAGRNANAPKR